MILIYMNESSISFTDPFVSILSLKITPETPCQVTDPEITKLFQQINFPDYNPQDLAKIGARLKKGATYTAALVGLDFEVPFKPNSFQIISKYYLLEDICISHYVLYQYVSWLLYFDKMGTTNFLPVILEALTAILPTSDYELAIRAFIKALTFYIGKKDFYKVDIYIKALKEFFKKGGELINGDAYNIFGLFFENLGFSDNTIEIIKLFSKMGQRYIQNIPPASAKYAISNLFDQILEMEPNSLELFFHLRDLIKSEFMIFLTNNFVPKIVETITAQPPTIVFTEESESPLHFEKLEKQLEPINRFVDAHTFVDGFNVTDVNPIPDRDEIASICHIAKLLKALQIFVKVVSLHKDASFSFLRTFEDSISVSSRNIHYFDLMAHFLIVAIEISKNYPLSDFAKFIYSDLLFNPTKLCLDGSLKVLNTLRSVAFETLLNCGAQSLITILNLSMEYPLLYAEIIYRCIQNRTILIPLVLESEKLVKTIIQSMLYFQSLSFAGHREVDEVRMSIFYLLSSIFPDPNIATLFFSHDTFVPVFLSFMFEIPVRPFVINQLRYFLTKDHESLKLIIGDASYLIFEIIKPLIPDQNALQLSNAFLPVLSEAVSHSKNMADIFTNVCRSVCSSFEALDDTEESKTFLLAACQLFAVSAHVYELTQKELEALEKSVQAVFGNKPPHSIFGKLIQIMASDRLLSLNPSFIIRQPLVIPVFFRIFNGNQQALDFISELCSFAKNNCVACHTSKLDLYILDTLYSKWFTRDLPDVQYVEACFQLVSKIAMVKSSPEVTKHFIALLCPQFGRRIPHYFLGILKTLNTIVTSTLKTPENSITITQDVLVEYENPTTITQGFTALFWVDLEAISPTYRPTIFNFYENENNFIKLFLQANIIVVCQRNKKIESQARVDQELPLRNWTFLSLTFKYDKELLIFPSINCEETRPIQFPKPDNLGVPWKLELGGATSSTESPAILGPFALFPILDQTEISRIFSHGPTQIEREECKPLFKYIPPTNQTRTINLSAVLVGFVNLGVLLPLFSMIDSRIEDHIIELLSNCLLMSNETEVEFAKQNGFSIVCHLLHSRNLDFSIYNRFFSLLQMLRTEQLQQQLLETILTNFELWSLTDNENHLRILRHWSRVLYSTAQTSMTFAHMLNSMVIFYPDSNKKFKVTKCRQYIISILLHLAERQFTIDDFHLMISHCMDCSDQGVVISILQLIVKMAKSQKSPLRNIDYILLLHSILQRKWWVTIQFLVEIVIELHRNNLIEGCTLSEHLAAIMNVIDVDLITDQLFNYLLTLLPGCPDLLNMLFFIGYILGEDRIRKIFPKPSPSLMTGPEWCVWPIIIAIHQENLCSQIMVFLASCGSKTWTNIYTTIAVVSKMFDINPEPTQGEFLLQISSRLLVHAIEPNYESFFHIVKHFLLYRDKEYVTHIMETFDPDDIPELAISSTLSGFLTPNSKLSFSHAGTPLARKDSKRDVPKPCKSANRLPELNQRTLVNSKSMNITPKMSPLGSPRQSPPDSPRDSGIHSPRDGASAIFDDVLGDGNEYSGEEDEFDFDHFVQQAEIIESKIVPLDYIERVKSIEDIHNTFMFGLRIDLNLKWLDFNLAQNTLSIIRETGANFDLNLVICSYIVHSHPKYVAMHLDRFTLSQRSIKAYQLLIDYVCFYLISHRIQCDFVKYRSPDMRTHALVALEPAIIPWVDPQYVEIENVLLKDLKQFEINRQETEDRVFPTEDIVKPIYIRETLIKYQHTMECDSKLWRQLWNSLTIDGAPWQAAIVGQYRYKRNPAISMYNVPLKLKIDWKFGKMQKTISLQEQVVEQMKDSVSSDDDDNYLSSTVPPLKVEGISFNDESIFCDQKFFNMYERNLSMKTFSFKSSARCEIISVRKLVPAAYTFFSDRLEILRNDNRVRNIYFKNIYDIQPRTRYHQSTAIEIYQRHKKSILINFPTTAIREIFSNLPKPQVESIQDITAKWQNRQISTFEYLVIINARSGRSFNDPSQYPIFPWVLNNYSSQSIDIKEPSIYRDFTKPIGAINVQRLKRLRERAEEYKRPNRYGYLYDHAMSTAIAVFNFLDKLAPFKETTKNLRRSSSIGFISPNKKLRSNTAKWSIKSGVMQPITEKKEQQKDGLNDPTVVEYEPFSSIPSTFEAVCSEANDFREITPEFFFQPEAFKNIDLPKWASSPIDFIYKHRKALESDYVCENLSEWFDLVWGTKSRGREAFKADNLYHPSLYANEPVPAQGIEKVGQIPKQIFHNPHPKREVINKTPLKAKMTDFKTSIGVVQFSSIQNGSKIILIDPESNLVVCQFDGQVFDQVTSTLENFTPQFIPISENKAAILGKTLTLLDLNDMSTTDTQINSDYKFGLSDDYIVMVDNNSIIKFYHKLKFHHTIMLIKENIELITISELYDTLIFAGNEEIIITTLSRPGTIKHVSLSGFIPHKIIVTQGWGFIVVYAHSIKDSEPYFLLFTLNGESIRQKKLDFNISVMYSAKTLTNFDYLFFASEKGHIYSCEAYFLEVSKPIIKCRSSVVEVKYDNEMELIIAVTIDGKIFNHTYSIEKLI